MRLDAATVRAAARGLWLSLVFPRLAPELAAAIAAGPGRHLACPVHGGRNGDAFRLYGDAEETGGAVCNSCGSHGDGFEVLRWLKGWSFPAALAAVADVLGMVPGAPPPPSPVPTRAPAPPPAGSLDTGRTVALCRATWREAAPAAGFVLRYLTARGAELAELPPDLRGHPALPYFLPGGRLLGTFPAMLALLRDGAGAVRGLHRTYLDSHNPGKADLRDPQTGARLPVKKVLSFAPRACAGCVVRLGPGAATLAVCEGIESAAVIQAATGVTTWAAYSAGALGSLELPVALQSLELWPDADPAGRAAAAKLGIRAASRGVAVRVFLPWHAAPSAPGKLPDAADVGPATVTALHLAGGFPLSRLSA